ncbi:class I adenylate-forming enzyme family protein [Streptomyces sp. AHA2]|uniref:class I adenylate-forming enzyme family protein n=1 Tax=Streptomyces sp. AHA2 TaxID=3064526 RepID=UPI002FE401E7
MKPYLWDPWLTAAEQPGRTAVLADGEHCTFAELTVRADALGRGLRSAGVEDGAVLTTDLATGPRFFALALAALRYGYGLLPVAPSLFGSGTAARLMSDANAVLHVSGTDPAAAGAEGLPVPSLTDEALASATRRGPLPMAARAGHLAFVTSGTTGEPQAVPRARPPRAYRGVAVDDRYAAGLAFGPHVMGNPAYHLGTLGPALYALQAGSAVVVQRTWSADGFADLVDRHGADSAFLGIDQLVDAVVADRPPARRLSILFHGGSACPPAVKRSAIDLFGPVLHEYYGTSRSTLTQITTQEWLEHPGSVGLPLPGIRIEIAREGRALAPGETGEICVRLRTADRESGDPELLRTGDLGFVDDGGYLFVVGRKTGAHQDGPDPAHLEYQVRLLAGVADVAVTGGAAPVCYVETLPGQQERTARQIVRAAELLGFARPVVRPVTQGTLPRTPSGKIRRAGLGTWWTTTREATA